MDGAGESKGGKAQQPDESVDPSDLAEEDIAEPNVQSMSLILHSAQIYMLLCYIHL